MIRHTHPIQHRTPTVREGTLSLGSEPLRFWIIFVSSRVAKSDRTSENEPSAIIPSPRSFKIPG
jgi:hypothetical protein